MPQNYKPNRGKRKYVTYTLEQLDNALKDLKNGLITQRQAALKYDIPRSTLKNKIKQAYPKKYGGQQIFT